MSNFGLHFSGFGLDPIPMPMSLDTFWSHDRAVAG